jgi:hypothetical protein
MNAIKPQELLSDKNEKSEKNSLGKITRGNSEKKSMVKMPSDDNPRGNRLYSAQICHYNGDSGSPSMDAHFNEDGFGEASELASVSPTFNAVISLGGRSREDNSNGLSNEAN